MDKNSFWGGGGGQGGQVAYIKVNNFVKTKFTILF